MLSVSRPLCVRSLVFCLAASLAAFVATPAAHAQASSGTSALDRQLGRVDFALSGVGVLTRDVSGTNYLGQSQDHNTSSTVGALIAFRYTKSPWKGGEFNIGYSRYTHNFSAVIVGGAQASNLEFTLGYVAHPTHQILGAQPFFGGGGGLLYFRPTSGGGQGLPNQGAGAIYYTVGLEKAISPHFGVRVLARQLFYRSPDFYQNYLNVNKYTSTFEPGFGLYVHF
ncbi:hypothetical protein [Edaphobacter bradus]|uniref:hypothetical protein n=1 Tax=Edaphobacter bradus TaxID=2259016 RepID=UPI0021DF4EDA|nr:hypothetical protein [Edaphobacter bradus]